MSLDPGTINETIEAAKAVGPIDAFGLNIKIFTAQLVNFTLVLLVLWRFAYRPIVRLLEEREEKIRKSVEQAQEMEKAFAASEERRQTLLNETRQEAQKIISDAQGQAKQQGVALAAKAKQEVERIVLQSKQNIVHEREKMFAEVKEEVVELAAKIAEKILKEEVDAKKSKAAGKDVMEHL